MSRRIASRDDLFLSALDLYTLLSLAFIGFTFFVAPSRDSTALDLPIATGSGNSQGTGRRTVQWVLGSAPSDAKEPHKAECKLQLTEPGEGQERRTATYTSPCLPRAFGAQPPLTKDARRLQAGAGAARPEVLILCRRSGGLSDCASLQWLMHESGFHTLAGVLAEH